MGGRIAGQLTLVAAGGDHDTTAHDHRADRHVIVIDGQTSLFDRRLHRFCQAGDRFVRRCHRCPAYEPSTRRVAEPEQGRCLRRRRASPSHCSAVGTSSRNTHPSTAICSSIVLLITADSPAPRRRSERFQSVKARAVLTTASQTMIASARGRQRHGTVDDESDDQQQDGTDGHRHARRHERRGSLGTVDRASEQAGDDVGAEARSFAAAIPVAVAPRSPLR